MQGILISFEGLEGAGKTTQVVRLQERLEQLGKQVISTREPGGTLISEQIRDVLFGKDSHALVGMSEVFLFQAARAQVYQELIIPALDKGQWVLADRGSDSSLVYQGVVRGFGLETIARLNELSTKATYPALTFLLDVPVEVGLGRRKGTHDVNRLDLESVDFHTQVRTAYLQLAQDESSRIVVIDANRSIEEIARDVWREVNSRFAVE